MTQHKLTIVAVWVDRDMKMYDAVIDGIGVVASKFTVKEAVDAASAFMRGYLDAIGDK